MKFCAIVLKRVEERVNAMKQLEIDLGVTINIFDAIEGKDYIHFINDFTHIRRDQEFTAGMFGCLLSHVEVLKSEFDSICIFEDDCEFIGNKNELYDFIVSSPPCDILCLGTNEHVDFTPMNSSYVKVTRFWGAHAFIITKKAAIAVLKTYQHYMKQKLFLPADWLYSYTIAHHGLIAYAPTKPKQYFQQKIGLVSTATNGIRT